MKLRLISLKTIRYSDTQSILTAFSRENGLVSFAIPAGKGKNNARIRALTLPLSVIECETDPQPCREILPMRQVRPLAITTSLHSDPIKQMVAMFLSEILSNTIRGGITDNALYDFIAGAIPYLDKAAPSGTANFHICFLYHLTVHMGIEPDSSTYHRGAVMDLRDGVWRSSPPLHPDYLPSDEAHAVYLLTRMTFDNMKAYRYNRRERTRILDGIIHYFGIHSTPLRSIRSLDILRSML